MGGTPSPSSSITSSSSEDAEANEVEAFEGRAVVMTGLGLVSLDWTWVKKTPIDKHYVAPQRGTKEAKRAKTSGRGAGGSREGAGEEQREVGDGRC